MFLWLLLALISLSVAGDDQIRVTLVVDDREAQRLSGAQVVVDHSPPVTAPLSDDGSCSGDMPGDHILTACFDIQKSETLSFGVLQGGQRLGAFNLFLPNASEAAVSLRARAGSPALLMDMAAEQPMYSAPDGPEDETRPKDKILVMVSIGGELGRGLRNPQLRAMDRDDAEPVMASDAGLLLGDKAGDGIWRADMAVLRTATLELGLFDDHRFLGTAEIPLPAKQRAYVGLRAGSEQGSLAFELSEQPPDADRELDRILVMVSIDDRVQSSLVSPELRLPEREGVAPVTAGDAGLLLGDRAGDGIWRADLLIDRTDTLALALYDGGEQRGAVEVDLPSNRRCHLVLELGMDGLASHFDERDPEEEQDDEEAVDRILLMLRIDDQQAGALTQPVVRVVGREGIEPVSASDAGLLLGDVADDGMWRADVSLVRSDAVTLELLDGDQPLGQVEISLPAKPRASLLLRAIAEDPGVAAVLEQELPSELSPDGEIEGVIETSLLRVSIQDSTDRALVAPVVSIEGQEGVEPVAASDQGLLEDDEAGDGTWRADVTVLRTPTLTLALEDGELPLGKATFSLPAAREVSVSLVRKGDPARLVVTTEAISSLGDQDSMVLVVELDDRAASLLSAPVVSIDQGDVEPAAAVDDGSIPGDVASDGIFLVELEVVRNPRVVITVRDGETVLGSVDAPLPASDSTTVRLRTRHGSPAVALVEELDMGGGPSGSGGSGGTGNLWLIVWLNIGLFVVLAAWVRRTVRRAIDKELRARGGAAAPDADPEP
jgi:hypothetical protein